MYGGETWVGDDGTSEGTVNNDAFLWHPPADEPVANDDPAPVAIQIDPTVLASLTAPPPPGGRTLLLPTTTPPQSDYIHWGGHAEVDTMSWGYSLGWISANDESPFEGNATTLPDGTVVASGWTINVTGAAPGTTLPGPEAEWPVLWQSGTVAVRAASPQLCRDPAAFESPAPETALIVTDGDAVIASVGVLPGVGGCEPGMSIGVRALLEYVGSMAICNVTEAGLECRPPQPPTAEQLDAAVAMLDIGGNGY